MQPPQTFWRRQAADGVSKCAYSACFVKMAIFKSRAEVIAKGLQRHRLGRDDRSGCDAIGRRRYPKRDRAEIIADHLEERFVSPLISNSSCVTVHHAQLACREQEFVSTPMPPLPGDYFVSLSKIAKAIFRLPKREAPGGPGTRQDTDRRIILRHLHCHLRQKQFGFRSGHLTTLQLTRVLHFGLQITIEATVPLESSSILRRLSTNCDILFKLFENTKIPPALVLLVASFLEGHSFFVTVEDTISDPRPINAGVPQGSCFSRCLCTVFIDDFPTLPGQLQDLENDVVFTLYPDDSVYLSLSRRTTLAPRNSEAAEVLRPTSGVRYLGVQIDRSLHIAAQIEQAIHQSRTTRSMLFSVLQLHPLLS
ncbi:RNA-directed DNA polymerase from mobile element jockey [Eumeta japonica]|uniref:RNA-directed DNA polymerase from mobile element jockey n=1 Tax=Eumeta variegata TaxID=151549 RepID=A0A4C1UIW9_EUMVA|nr:RNA-directed DNA polymerase from mobile element jockey [Eumeta japonica]